MRANPAHSKAGFLARTGAFFENLFSSQSLATHPAFAACVLVLVVGVGTSYASQSALPGEPLYAFKTRVNEPIQGALALSPEAKTEWSAELTFRRLQEAEELAATGDLSVVASADIEKGLNLALTKFENNVKLLEEKENIAAANAQSDLEASLNAHEVVLAALPSTQKSDTKRITTAVQKHAESITKKRTASQATLTATDTPQVKDAALKRKKTAEDVVGAVKLLSTKTKDAKLASSTLKIAEQAKRDIEIGDNEAKEGRWGKAFSAFEDAVRKANETKKSVDTRSWLTTRFGVGVGVDDSAASTTATSTFEVIEEVETSTEPAIEAEVNVDL